MPKSREQLVEEATRRWREGIAGQLGVTPGPVTTGKFVRGTRIWLANWGILRSEGLSIAEAAMAVREARRRAGL